MIHIFNIFSINKKIVAGKYKSKYVCCGLLCYSYESEYFFASRFSPILDPSPGVNL